jgi:tRNA U34 2-thiouridine synthase MnmA/TrmU
MRTDSGNVKILMHGRKIIVALSGGVEAAGAVALFADCVYRVQDCVTHFMCHIWQHKTVRGAALCMHYEELSYIV